MIQKHPSSSETSHLALKNPSIMVFVAVGLIIQSYRLKMHDSRPTNNCFSQLQNNDEKKTVHYLIGSKPPPGNFIIYSFDLMFDSFIC